jgi:hypothetical protein
MFKDSKVQRFKGLKRPWTLNLCFFELKKTKKAQRIDYLFIFVIGKIKNNKIQKQQNRNLRTIIYFD